MPETPDRPQSVQIFTASANVGHSVTQRLAAEALGTALLLAAVIGSGIMASKLSAGQPGLALLANTLVTVWALFVWIELFAPISGAHFNPLVSLLLLWPQDKRVCVGYVCAQALGAVAGTALAHAMFDAPLLQVSDQIRSGGGQFWSELFATAGLVFVVLRAPQLKVRASVLIACYVGVGYWAGASTGFVNPAAVLGRLFTNTYAGISPASAGLFVVAQCLGAVLGWGLHRLFTPRVSVTD